MGMVLPFPSLLPMERRRESYITRKDAGIMLVRKFVAKYARTDTDEIDVKDQKQKNIARNELPEEYRKQADYFHLHSRLLFIPRAL